MIPFAFSLQKQFLIDKQRIGTDIQSAQKVYPAESSATVEFRAQILNFFFTNQHLPHHLSWEKRMARDFHHLLCVEPVVMMNDDNIKQEQNETSIQNPPDWCSPGADRD